MPDVGPAYAKPPRDTQRDAIDKTFRDLVENAHAIKGSVFDTPTDAAFRDVSDPTRFTAGVLVPKFGAAKGFSPAEQRAQRMWGKYWPKLLEAFKNDKRPGGEYILDLLNKPMVKGETEAAYKGIAEKGLTEPIRVSLNPKTFGMETGPHEADHAFAIRRNQQWGKGNQQNLGGFKDLDPEIRELYTQIGGGDPFHGATYYRADEAAKRLGLVPGRGASLRGE
jgi:hypothetical protein